jgi:hypothetical protein
MVLIEYFGIIRWSVFYKNYSSKKRGCKLEKCCCEQEKLEAKSKDRIRRKRGAK